MTFGAELRLVRFKSQQTEVSTGAESRPEISISSGARGAQRSCLDSPQAMDMDIGQIWITAGKTVG